MVICILFVKKKEAFFKRRQQW